MRVPACDRACLIGHLAGPHEGARRARSLRRRSSPSNVRFTENNVFLPVGDGLWDTVTGVDAAGLEAADPTHRQRRLVRLGDRERPPGDLRRAHPRRRRRDRRDRERGPPPHRAARAVRRRHQDGPRPRVQRGPAARAAPQPRAHAGDRRRLFRHRRGQRRPGLRAVLRGLRPARERHLDHRAAAGQRGRQRRGDRLGLPRAVRARALPDQQAHPPRLLHHRRGARRRGRAAASSTTPTSGTATC